MYCLCPDVYLTRRQRLHFVVTDDHHLSWSGKSFIEAVEFLLNEGQTEFHLDGGDDHERLLLTVRKV